MIISFRFIGVAESSNGHKSAMSYFSTSASSLPLTETNPIPTKRRSTPYHSQEGLEQKDLFKVKAAKL